MNEPLHAVEPIVFTETWWGETLGDGLISRVRAAPDEQIDEFIDAVRHDQRPKNLPPLRPGNLRPIFLRSSRGESRSAGRDFSYASAALRALMYAHEAAVEDPFRLVGSRDELVNALRVLTALRPLAELGVLHFFHASDRLHHPSRAHRFTSLNSPEALEVLRANPDLVAEMERLSALPASYDVQAGIFAARSSLGQALTLVTGRDDVNLIATTAEEAVLLPVGLRAAALSSRDLRHIHTEKLIALPLPDFKGEDLALLRAESDEFHEWRTSLARALSYIDGIQYGDDKWQRESEEVLSSELEPVRSRLQRAVDTSPALAAARSGVVNLGYTGIGALSGALVTGGVGGALAGAAATTAAEVGAGYLARLHERRRSRALLAVVMSFYRRP